ncbi:MAG: hypothetical protein GY716_14835 [bacterium]|nr:hypothetical protein [bacterium]
MGPQELKWALWRLFSGTAGSVAAGFLVFRSDVFRFGSPAFQCLTVGVLFAAVLGLMRSDHRGYALALAFSYGIVRVGTLALDDLFAAVAELVLAFGVYMVALIFDLMARNGLLIGKFLIVGPLLGAAYLAATPLAQFYFLTESGTVRMLLEHVFLGIVIGDGVGLGVEIVDLVEAVQPEG